MSNSNRSGSPASFSCPSAAPKGEVIVLGHGSGGRLTAELVSRVFLPALSNPLLDDLNDSAEMKVGASRVVFTTNSFVVNPLRFPGGDIGSLAVNGTVNDLAVAGGQPIGLSAAFILEEGFPTAELEAIAQSMRTAADRAGVAVIAADTKVVEHGKADGLFITTSGIGVVAGSIELGPERIQVGDAVLVSSPIGDHGIAVISAREGLEFRTTIVTDSAPLNGLVSLMLESGGAIRCMRDPTRGGVATVVNELTKGSGVEIVIEETLVPVHSGVRAACEILGLDILYVACEGRLIAIVDSADAAKVLAAMRRHPLGSDLPHRHRHPKGGRAACAAANRLRNDPSARRARRRAASAHLLRLLCRAVELVEQRARCATSNRDEPSGVARQINHHLGDFPRPTDAPPLSIREAFGSIPKLVAIVTRRRQPHRSQPPIHCDLTPRPSLEEKRLS